MSQFKKAEYVQAIEMKCAECIYDPRPGNGTWREQVEACTATSCPLFGVRPLTQNHKHPEPLVIPSVVRDRRLAFSHG